MTDPISDFLTRLRNASKAIRIVMVLDIDEVGIFSSPFLSISTVPESKSMM